MQNRIMITGAGSGLGREIALRWAREGWRLALADVNEAGLRETLELARAAGGEGFAKVNAIFQQHCVVCHGTAIQQKGVRLDTPDAVKSHAQQIYQQVVQLKKMPFGNPGALSEDERNLIKTWYESGAAVN